MDWREHGFEGFSLRVASDLDLLEAYLKRLSEEHNPPADKGLWVSVSDLANFREGNQCSTLYRVFEGWMYLGSLPWLHGKISLDRDGVIEVLGDNLTLDLGPQFCKDAIKRGLYPKSMSQLVEQALQLTATSYTQGAITEMLRKLQGLVGESVPSALTPIDPPKPGFSYEANQPFIG